MFLLPASYSISQGSEQTAFLALKLYFLSQEAVISSEHGNGWNRVFRVGERGKPCQQGAAEDSRELCLRNKEFVRRQCSFAQRKRFGVVGLDAVTDESGALPHSQGVVDNDPGSGWKIVEERLKFITAAIEEWQQEFHSGIALTGQESLAENSGLFGGPLIFLCGVVEGFDQFGISSGSGEEQIGGREENGFRQFLPGALGEGVEEADRFDRVPEEIEAQGTA